MCDTNHGGQGDEEGENERHCRRVLEAPWLQLAAAVGYALRLRAEAAAAMLACFLRKGRAFALLAYRVRHDGVRVLERGLLAAARVLTVAGLPCDHGDDDVFRLRRGVFFLRVG